VRFFRTYAGAACQACDLGLIGLAAMQRVVVNCRRATALCSEQKYYPAMERELQADVDACADLVRKKRKEARRQRAAGRAPVLTSLEAKKDAAVLWGDETLVFYPPLAPASPESRRESALGQLEVQLARLDAGEVGEIEVGSWGAAGGAEPESPPGVFRRPSPEIEVGEG